MMYSGDACRAGENAVNSKRSVTAELMLYLWRSSTPSDYSIPDAMVSVSRLHRDCWGFESLGIDHFKDADSNSIACLYLDI